MQNPILNQKCMLFVPWFQYFLIFSEMKCFIDCLASSHYLNQYWIIVNWTNENTFSWNFIKTQLFSLTKPNLKISSKNGGHFISAICIKIAYSNLYQWSVAVGFIVLIMVTILIWLNITASISSMPDNNHVINVTRQKEKEAGSVHLLMQSLKFKYSVTTISIPNNCCNCRVQWDTMFWYVLKLK